LDDPVVYPVIFTHGTAGSAHELFNLTGGYAVDIDPAQQQPLLTSLTQATIGFRIPTGPIPCVGRCRGTGLGRGPNPRVAFGERWWLCPEAGAGSEWGRAAAAGGD
jgi:hypothetical protein